MPAYVVRHARSNGEQQLVRIDAPDAQTAAQRLARQNGGLLSVASVDRAPPAQIPGGVRAAGSVLRDLSAACAAGTSLQHALQRLASNADSRAAQEIAGALLIEVKAGATLHDAIAARTDVFPAPIPAVIENGLTNEHLAETLRALADWLDARGDTAEISIGAFTSPLLAGLIAMLGAYGVLLVEKTAINPSDINWGVIPETNAGLLATLALSGLFAIGLGFAGVWRFPKLRRSAEALALSAPFLGPICRAHVAARFLGMLSILLSARTPGPDALRLAARAAPFADARERLLAGFARAKQGSSLPNIDGLAGALPHGAISLLDAPDLSPALAPPAAQLAEHYKGACRARMRHVCGLLGLVGSAGVGAIAAIIAIATVGF